MTYEYDEDMALQNQWAACDAVNKYGRDNGLKADRYVQGKYGVMIFVDREEDWNDWLKHIEDIDPDKQGTWEFYEVSGTIAAVPIMLLLNKKKVKS